MRAFALIPAAGKSSRMGRPKLILPLGNRTVLECTIAALRQAGIAEILVVVGPDSGELAEVADKAGASVLQLASDTADMQATVLRGLAWLEDRFHPAGTDFWLLVPADHPALEPEPIRELLRASHVRPEKSIFIPTYGGRRGHPTLVAWRHARDLRTWPGGQGLNHFFRSNPTEVCECPVSAPEVLLDMDTPEDYERMAKAMDKKKAAEN